MCTCRRPCSWPRDCAAGDKPTSGTRLSSSSERASRAVAPLPRFDPSSQAASSSRQRTWRVDARHVPRNATYFRRPTE